MTGQFYPLLRLSPQPPFPGDFDFKCSHPDLKSRRVRANVPHDGGGVGNNVQHKHEGMPLMHLYSGGVLLSAVPPTFSSIRSASTWSGFGLAPR
ncbi:hypothetical protein ARTHROSP310_26800 [Arthrobacter sp. AD-310]